MLWLFLGKSWVFNWIESRQIFSFIVFFCVAEMSNVFCPFISFYLSYCPWGQYHVPVPPIILTGNQFYLLYFMINWQNVVPSITNLHHMTIQFWQDEFFTMYNITENEKLKTVMVDNIVIHNKTNHYSGQTSNNNHRSM